VIGLLVPVISAVSTGSVQLAARRPVRHDIARLVSTTAAPAPVAAVLLLGAACYMSQSLTEGLALGALLATCATLPATLYIEHVLQRNGRHHYFWRRSKRLAPLVIACASVFATIVLVRALDAPHHLQTVLLTMFFVLGLTLIATSIHRISVHMAAITGASVVLQLLFGNIAIAALPLVAIVGWSRVELREHTPAQVVSGAVVGAVGASAAYALLG
jgi:membrane-associated phospholipid phosphatase